MNPRYIVNTNTYEEVINVKIPQATKSYTPVLNKDIILGLKEVLNHYNFNINKEFYQLAKNDNQLFGAFTIQCKDTEIQKCVGFRNSYDKTLPVGFVAGAEVIVCSNLMFEGSIKKIRKHSLNVYDDLQNLMEEIVLDLNTSFNKIKEQKEKLKQIQIDKYLIGELISDLFIQEDIISSTQLSVFKHEWKKKEQINLESNIYKQNGWDIMNHLTESLKKTHPSKRMEEQLIIHEYLVDNLL